MHGFVYLWLMTRPLRFFGIMSTLPHPVVSKTVVKPQEMAAVVTGVVLFDWTGRMIQNGINCPLANKLGN